MSQLRKELGLFAVYAISAGAMFSSGFFLLPGLAAAMAGPAVVLAYILAAALVTPAMFSMAELASAMPRAGGTYFFLDRTLGPLAGTIGGFGTWLAMVLKSSFALIGMGAYLSLFLDVPIKPLAVLLTILFTLVNILGAKASSGMQRVLVITLLTILSAFILSGFATLFDPGGLDMARERFTPFLATGGEGLVATVGLVFVSYVGLTKIASIPEEVKDPDRNLPRAMVLSLATAVTVYVLGISVMVAVLDPAVFQASLTPVAAAGEVVLDWLPGRMGMMLIVLAAVAAFSAMANAGVMTASRYPLAMARDHLVWDGFARLGRFRTPTASIVATGALMILGILALDVLSVAKLASSLQLLLFAFVNLAVIVMRESRIPSYDPGFRSPLYPWGQLIGFLVPIILIVEMGILPILFTLGVTLAAAAWYNYYARHRVEREGAVFHVFERLGRRRFAGLDPELRQILKEKGLREEDPFEEVVAGSFVIDQMEEVDFEALVDQAASILAAVLDETPERLAEAFLSGTRRGATPVAHSVALPHLRLAGIGSPRMVMARSRTGIRVTAGEGGSAEDPAVAGGVAEEPVRALFFLASPAEDPGQHLRILAQLAGRADDDDFMEQWLQARGEQELRETLLRDERYLSLWLREGTRVDEWIGRPLREVMMPEGCLVALIRRQGQEIIPRGATVLKAADRLTILGDPEAIRELREDWMET